MSKKRDLYNMDDYYEPPEDYEDPEAYIDPEAVEGEEEEPYPEMGGGGYLDKEGEGEDLDYESEQIPVYEGDGEDYYDLYNPDFQRFLLKNGIIKFSSSDSEDSNYSEDSDEDLGKLRKKTSRKKSAKKKTTKRKRK